MIRLILGFATLCVGVRAEPLVNTTGGWVQGIVEDDVVGYLGIPYAKKPIDSLRFALPEAHDGWNGILNATTAASKCVQDSGGDENCLVINIFAPLFRKNESAAAVIFLIHGGGFVSGSARIDLFPTCQKTGLVLAAPQYRLGVFGFACENRSCDNVGLADQRMALMWTVQNAAAFGGDPSRILVMGGSAGGASIDDLLLRPELSGLFAAVSLESPGGHQGWMGDDRRTDDDWMSHELRVNNTAAVLDALGCQDLDDARRVDAAQLWTVSRNLRLAPSLIDADGRDDFPLRRIRTGRWHNRVPVIIGGVSCESCADAEAYIGPPSGNVTRTQYMMALQAYFHDAIVSPLEIERWYADRVPKDGYWRTFARVLSDSGHACSTALHALAFSNTSTLPVWRYFFAYTDGDLPGATHGSDEPYILGLKPPFQLSDVLLSWWASLATSGDPNFGVDRNIVPPYWQVFNPPWHRRAMYMGVDANTSRLGKSFGDILRPECERHWARYLGWEQ